MDLLASGDGDSSMSMLSMFTQQLARPDPDQRRGLALEPTTAAVLAATPLVLLLM